MIMPLSVAEKLLQLAGSEQLPASSFKHAIVEELILEGIVLERISGRTKRTLFVADASALNNWIFNRYSIADLAAYIAVMRNTGAFRADQVASGNDSKLKTTRTFKGFLVNCYQPIGCTLYGLPYTIHPAPGTFQFIYDFEQFKPGAGVTIVGVENAENFRWVERQQHLFPGISPLFVSRYPQEQSKDLLKWLCAIPNAYLHFGDFDFAGISIYLSEYKKHLGARAFFFIPNGIEQLIERFGNRKLYDQQKAPLVLAEDENLTLLIEVLHKHKKGLEQEAFLIA